VLVSATLAWYPGSALAVDPVRSNAEWILSAQLGDGAITISPHAAAIWPYLSNLAAVGLASATVATGDRRYVDGAWRWLDWYQAHEDSAGTVTNYTVVGAAVASTGTEDSTDAYAGTFLMAVAAAHAADPLPANLETLRRGMAGAMAAIEAVQDADGLTFAKPSWHVKYLMDQSETYAGLHAATAVWADLGDRSEAARASRDAERIRAGVASLWDPADGAYDWALHGETGHQRTDWSELYPDALEQLWPVAYGLAPVGTAAQLIARFGFAHPNWAMPTALDDIGGSPQVIGYQAVAAIAFAAAGDASRAAAAASTIEAAAEKAGRAWPFTPADAGELISLETTQVGTMRAGRGTTGALGLALPAPAQLVPPVGLGRPVARGVLTRQTTRRADTTGETRKRVADLRLWPGVVLVLSGTSAVAWGLRRRRKHPAAAPRAGALRAAALSARPSRSGGPPKGPVPAKTAVVGNWRR
jgi:hypothetical protein